MGCGSSVQTSTTVMGTQQQQEPFGGNLTFGASTYQPPPEQETVQQINVFPLSRPQEPEPQPQPQPQIHVQPVVQVQQTPQAQENFTFQPTPGQPDVNVPADENEVFRNQEHGVRYSIGEVSQVLKSIDVDLYDAKAHTPQVEAAIKKENKYLKAITVRFDMDETENVDYYITDFLKTGAYTSYFISFERLSTVSEKALQTFGQHLVRHGLEKLTLMHCNTDATDKFFENVLTPLKKNNKSLKFFKLDFIECPQVTDESIRHVKEVLEGNQELEQFSVFIGKTSKITDKSISYVKAALQNKPNINRLDLGFQEMKQLTDGVLPIFLEIIKSFPKLTYLNFCTPNAGYSDAAFNSFEESLKAMNLRFLDITWKVPQYF